MIHHSIAKKQGPKEGNSVRRVTRLAACLTAVSTLGAGLIMPITAVADDATPAVQTTTTSANVRAAANTATADPIASFDFNSDPDDGAFASAQGDAKATVQGTVDLVNGKDDDNGKAAQLGSGFWLNVTKSDGSALLNGLDDVTISYDSKAAATGGQWTVFAAPTAGAVNGSAPTYVGVLDRTDKTRVERYLNGRASDIATIDKNTGTKDAWKHVDLVISGKTAKLYVDKKFVASNVNGEDLKSILGGSGGVLQIGKGNWGNGEYFTGLLDNLTIYGSALSAADLGIASPTAIEISGSNVKDGKLSLKEGNSASLSATVTPEGAEPTVTWESNNPAVATVDTNGKVTGVKAGTATITAASEADAAKTAELKVTVTEVKADDAYGYVMVHFIENNKGYAEKIYLDISRGDDATQWDTLNGGEPILVSNESTTGVRDPFIAYNPESKTYYVLATDLRVFGGDNAGRGTWATGYSTKLHVWSSKDLIHFNDMTELETATADKYTANPNKSQTLTDSVTGKTISEIGMAWAPEATWVPNFYDLNDDGQLNGSDKDNPKNQQGGAFVVYWSVSAKYDGENSQPGKKVTHVLWAATKDFTNETYMFGGVFVPNSKYNRGNTIDTTMLQNSSRTYRTTGSGVIFMEYTDRADWWRANDQGQYATDPAKGWVLRQTNIGHTLGSAQEGANGFKVNGENKWYMFVDNYGSVASGARYGYNLLEADNLDSENPWSVLKADDYFLTANTKHGGIVSLTKAQYDAIRAADAKASDNADLKAEDVTVDKGSADMDITAKLPKTQQVTLANGYGTAKRDVMWDVSNVDTSKPGEYTVTGTVDTIGANKNHWKWTNAAGESKTDEDDLINSGANANNNWKQTGGFVDNETANKNRTLYSSTAITVTAKVTVTGETEPTDPDLLADFTFDDGDKTFDGGNATGATQGTATLADSKDGKAAKLSKNFWLNVTAKNGDALLKGKNDVTISYDVKPDVSGNTGWTFFAASNATKQEYGQEHYVGVLDKTTGITVERYNNNDGKRDSSGNVSYTKTNADWKHVDIVISGATAKLYIDSKLVAVNNNGQKLTDILGADGGVLQIGKANWSNGEYFSGLLDNLKIWGKALSDDELGVESAKTDYAAALAIPAQITGDLPSTVLGKTVTWSATGDGAKLVAADGKVTQPKSGEKAVKVKLTATIDGVDKAITAESEILNNGGEIASYVKDVDRSDQNGAKYDPLAYNDDRRADSLYVAAKAADGSKWEPLNRSQSILSVKWDGSQSAKLNAQMGSPAFFRAEDGTLGVVSSQNNATGAIYVWDGKGDGATFTNERAITVTDSSIVTNPRIVYDDASKGYKVFWADGLSGEGRMATLSDLTAKATVGETLKADAVAMGVGDVTEGLPAWAGEGQIRAFAVSSSEFDAFYKNYVDLQNTGVKALGGATVENGASAEDVTAAVSGTQATMTYNDGSTKTFNVDWNADDLAAVDTSKAGTHEVKGTVQQTTEAMYNDARADPDIFYNEDDGYYYLTGSTYEIKSTDSTNNQKDSYRSIGLKRAKTINGLKDAAEHIIIKPENGTPGHEDRYPNSFYGWSAFIWAQEFHKINGKWWIVAGFHKGASSANGGWCNNTILIPYTGDEQSIKDGGFLEAENWGEPTVLEGAAFDVTYFEREENGKAQGYWLFPKSAGLYLAKAKMGDGVTPLVDGSLEHIYQVSQQFEYGKYAPTPEDNSEGSDQAIVEAPFMFEHGDYVYIAYAGATVDKYYNTNVMRAAKNADLQDLSSWTTADFPSFDTNDTYTGAYGADEASYERKQAGPGHISLAHDEAGNIVMAYHARPYPEIHSGSAAGGLFDQDRNTWVKAVNVRANGMLDMSLTKDQEVAPANRTVTITVTVGEPDTPVEPSITGIRVKSEPTKTKYTVGEQFSADGLVIEATMSDGTVKTLDAADYTVGDVDMSAVGTKTVTVALKANDQLTTSFVVTVSAKTEPGKPGSGDGSGDGAGGDNGNAGTGADSGLPSSGAAVLGLGGAVVVLAVAGISLTIWRKRRA